MEDRELKNRIHGKTAIVAVVFLAVTTAAYFFRRSIPLPLGVEVWLLMLPLAVVVIVIRVLNTELGIIRRRPPT